MVQNIVRLVTPLRVYKTIMLALLVTLAVLIYKGGELHDSLTNVNDLSSVGMLLAAIACAVAVITDEDGLYRVSYTLSNTVLSWWAFILAVYASYGLANWGSVVVYSYVVVQNYWILPQLIEQKAARDAIERATNTAMRANVEMEERKSSGGG